MISYYYITDIIVYLFYYSLKHFTNYSVTPWSSVGMITVEIGKVTFQVCTNEYLDILPAAAGNDDSMIITCQEQYTAQQGCSLFKLSNWPK